MDFLYSFLPLLLSNCQTAMGQMIDYYKTCQAPSLPLHEDSQSQE